MLFRLKKLIYTLITRKSNELQERVTFVKTTYMPKTTITVRGVESIEK